MNQKVSMLQFEKEQIESLIANLGFKFKSLRQRQIVVDGDGEPQKCLVCERQITDENVGSVAHGSNHFFCDNPMCFLSYLEKKRKE